MPRDEAHLSQKSERLRSGIQDALDDDRVADAQIRQGKAAADARLQVAAWDRIAVRVVLRLTQGAGYAILEGLGDHVLEFDPLRRGLLPSHSPTLRAGIVPVSGGGG